MEGLEEQLRTRGAAAMGERRHRGAGAWRVLILAILGCALSCAAAPRQPTQEPSSCPPRAVHKYAEQIRTYLLAGRLLESGERLALTKEMFPEHLWSLALYHFAYEAVRTGTLTPYQRELLTLEAFPGCNPTHPQASTRTPVPRSQVLVPRETQQPRATDRPTRRAQDAPRVGCR